MEIVFVGIVVIACVFLAFALQGSYMPWFRQYGEWFFVAVAVYILCDHWLRGAQRSWVAYLEAVVLIGAAYVTWSKRKEGPKVVRPH